MKRSLKQGLIAISPLVWVLMTACGGGGGPQQTAALQPIPPMDNTPQVLAAVDQLRSALGCMGNNFSGSPAVALILSQMQATQAQAPTLIPGVTPPPPVPVPSPLLPTQLQSMMGAGGPSSGSDCGGGLVNALLAIKAAVSNNCTPVAPPNAILGVVQNTPTTCTSTQANCSCTPAINDPVFKQYIIGLITNYVQSEGMQLCGNNTSCQSALAASAYCYVQNNVLPQLQGQTIPGMGSVSSVIASAIPQVAACGGSASPVITSGTSSVPTGTFNNSPYWNATTPGTTVVSGTTGTTGTTAATTTGTGTTITTSGSGLGLGLAPTQAALSDAVNGSKQGIGLGLKAQAPAAHVAPVTAPGFKGLNVVY